MWKLPNPFAEIEQRNVIYGFHLKIGQSRTSERAKNDKVNLIAKNTSSSLPSQSLDISLNTPSIRHDARSHMRLINFSHINEVLLVVAHQKYGSALFRSVCHKRSDVRGLIAWYEERTENKWEEKAQRGSLEGVLTTINEITWGIEWFDGKILEVICFFRMVEWNIWRHSLELV